VEMYEIYKSFMLALKRRSAMDIGYTNLFEKPSKRSNES